MGEAAMRTRHKDRGYRKRDDTTRVYEVLYCPCNSFPSKCFFTLREVQDMLANDYLAIGTIFRVKRYYYAKDGSYISNKYEYREVTPSGMYSRTQEQVDRRINHG